MASTRSASPASDAGPPELLTPRSKIKALLAGVESSDDENTTPKSRKSVQKRSPVPERAESRLRTSNEAQLQQTDDSEDESDVEIRPRGRLAARMHGDAPPAPKPDTATAPEKQSDPLQKDERRGDIDIGEDEDDYLPVAPRRLHGKAPREQTPENTDTGARSPSPGLFVSSPDQPSPAKTVEHRSDSEGHLPATRSDRFKALVERKKQERLDREAAEGSRKAERRSQQEKLASEVEQLDSGDDNPSDIEDDEGGLKLTQEARPTRKASKKAIEDMNRETQRMARSMQLAHEARTRKKISKSSLFKRFNFRPAGEPDRKMTSSSRPGTPQSDVEMKDAETPPSSPPVVDAKQTAEVAGDATADRGDDNELPPAGELGSSQFQSKLDKGKGKEIATENPETTATQRTTKPKRQVRVRLPRPSVNHATIESDDELEITTAAKDRIGAIFDHLPARKDEESHSLQALRALAQLKSPGKENKRAAHHSGMTASELQAYLHQKARQQAKMERDRRMNMLKAQGVVVQTAEERERQEQEVEDIVAKAREEAQQIMQQERAAAKKNEGDGGNDPLAWDDSEDEDYEDPANEADAEASAIELSGSEDEEEEGEGSDNEDAGHAMFDEEAEDGESDAPEEPAEPARKELEEKDDEDDDQELPANRKRRTRKQVAVLSDDEADIEATPKPQSKAAQATPTIPSTDTPNAPSSVLRSAKKSFIPGLPVEGPAGLGLTQIFAGTMDDSQMSPGQGQTQSMMPDFDNFPDSNFSVTMDEPVESTLATQKNETQGATQGVQLNLSQTQMHGLDSLMRDMANTQHSEMMELSQDGGFQEHTPLKDRFVDPPHSTADTVVLGQEDATQQDSPLIRRGRLRRKIEASDPGDDLVPTAVEDAPAPQTAFSLMKDNAEKEKKKRAAEAFDRKKSKAKEMVEEVAEESEDEYQGLGGYDGEDSDDESVASVKDMIDDAAGNDVDERELAAFYADRERANDEKQVEKLFKDITNGMLRRKRGADYDLSDSDDDGEARRKMKRRQFAKMQKALFADERVKKMAENPGNQAFLKTIEDRGSDDEMDFLDVVREPTQESSQSQSQDAGDAQQQVVPDSQPRPALSDAPENRAPAPSRRTRGGKKPSNIGDVRQTLSNLLEDEREGSVIPATEAGSDSENEEHPPSARSDKENHAPSQRRTGASVVDRISLKRNASSNMSTSTASRLAFNAQANSSSFKVPALLRRATTNSFMSTSSTASTNSTGAGSAGGFGEEAKIKKTAGKRSGVNAFARESERRAKIQKSEQKREEKKVRGAERRVGVVGGLLRKGSFE